MFLRHSSHASCRRALTTNMEDVQQALDALPPSLQVPKPIRDMLEDVDTSAQTLLRLVSGAGHSAASSAWPLGPGAAGEGGGGRGVGGMRVPPRRARACSSGSLARSACLCDLLATVTRVGV
jgi:hypothetical protein